MISAEFGRCLAKRDIRGVSAALDQILSLRDTMVKYGIWSSFTYVMNRLGFPGYFNPDYVELSVDSQEVLDNRLMVMGEII